MIEMMIEVIVIAGTLLFARFAMKRNAEKTRRVYAISFVLLIAVCIAFCIAQCTVAAGFLSATLSFSPMEVLSLIVVVWWLSYVTAGSKMFDRLIGENRIQGYLDKLYEPFCAVMHHQYRCVCF